MEPLLLLRRFRLERGLNSGPLDQLARTLSTELPGLLNRLEFAMIVLLLVITSGDAETNFDPINQTTCSSDNCFNFSLQYKLER